MLIHHFEAETQGRLLPVTLETSREIPKREKKFPLTRGNSFRLIDTRNSCLTEDSASMP